MYKSVIFTITSLVTVILLVVAIYFQIKEIGIYELF